MCLWPMNPAPDPDPAIFILYIQDANKKPFYLLLFEGTFT